jgi:hypothetical protein
LSDVWFNELPIALALESWPVSHLISETIRGALAVDVLLKGARPYDVAKTFGDTVIVLEQHDAPSVKELRERIRKIMASTDGIEKTSPDCRVIAHQPPLRGKVQ